jgi:hypothetical protein
MLGTWLLAGLFATGPVSDRPFARLFRLESDVSKTGVQAPRFRQVPGRQRGGGRVDDEGVDIVCGMTVIRKSPHIDQGIALPAHRGADIAVRRIEPGACGAGQRGRSK